MMNHLSISQTTSKPVVKVISDSTNINYIAFNKEYATILINELKLKQIDEKLIKEYEKKLDEYKNFIILKEKQVDSLKGLNRKAYEIVLNKDKTIELNTKQNQELLSLIDTLNKKVTLFEDKVKKKNRVIKVLTTTNLVTLVIIVLLIL